MGWTLSRPAETDLMTIYIEGMQRFGPMQADAYHHGLEGTFDLLAASPRMARERSDIEPPVRVHRYKAHVVVYEIDGDDVRILRVRHGREDWLDDPGGER